MAPSRLPITTTVATAYSDVGRVWRALPLLLICAALIIIAVKVMEDFVPPRLWSGAILGTVLGLVVNAVQSFCLAPIMIAIHRFIILDEVKPGYVLDPGQPGFLPFFGWLVVVSVLIDLVFSVQEALTAIGLSALTALVPTFVVLIAVLIVLMRLTILFPAIAVGARGASRANAVADSKGHAFSIFLIFLLAQLPMAALSIGVTLMLGRGVMEPGTPAAMVHLVLGGAIQVIVTVLCVAIASRAFQALADRVSLRT